MRELTLFKTMFPYFAGGVPVLLAATSESGFGVYKITEKDSRTSKNSNLWILFRFFLYYLRKLWQSMSGRKELVRINSAKLFFLPQS